METLPIMVKIPSRKNNTNLLTTLITLQLAIKVSSLEAFYHLALSLVIMVGAAVTVQIRD